MPTGQLPGLNVPDWWLDTGSAAFGSALLIDATGEKAAMVGRVHIPGGGSKNISKVGFRFGAVTLVALETLTLSLQDVSLTTGMPDETQDQSVTIANASIAANTWFEATLGSTRTVTNGDLLSVVWEYLNFVLTASVVISTLPGQIANQVCYPALKSGAGPTWASITAAGSVIPLVVLGFDDGTFGTLLGAGVAVISGLTINNGTATKEVGNRIITSMPGIIEGAWAFVDLDGDASVNLYEALPDGTSEALIQTLAVDKDVRNQTNNRLLWVPFPAEINMKPGWTYYVTMIPTTSTSVVFTALTVNTAGYWAASAGGTEVLGVTRGTAGAGNAWTTSTTVRYLLGLRLRGDRYPVRSAGMST